METEMNGLYKFVLIMLMVGMVIGVGTILLDKTSVATKTTGSVGNTTAAVTFTSGVGTAAFDELIAITACHDATNNTHIAVSAAGCRIGNAATGTILIPASEGTPVKVNLTYTYYADSSSSVVIDSATSAVGGIASSWLGLVVTIFVLSIVLGLVIAGFSGYRRE